MKTCFKRLLPIALLSSASYAVAAPPSPMLDADCSEYPALGAVRQQVAPGMDLYIYQDAHYVWMCYTLPPGSRGQLDMQLQAPALASVLNLHVSAQLGEWPLDRDELVPKSPESDRWWETSGWTGTVLRINGMDTSGPAPRYRWKDARAREVQLSKARFGRGEWRFSMDIHQVRQGDGALREVRFPSQGTYSLKAL